MNQNRSFSQLVERAARGEKIGITKRGKLVAVMGPAYEEVDIDELFVPREEDARCEDQESD